MNSYFVDDDGRTLYTGEKEEIERIHPTAREINSPRPTDAHEYNVDLDRWEISKDRAKIQWKTKRNYFLRNSYWLLEDPSSPLTEEEKTALSSWRSRLITIFEDAFEIGRLQVPDFLEKWM